MIFRRMNTLRALVVLTSATFACFLCTVCDLNAQGIDPSTSYLPLRIGNLWDYAFAPGNPVVRTARVTDTLRWGGPLYYTMIYDTGAGYPAVDTLRVDSLGRVVSILNGAEVIKYDFTKVDADTYHVPVEFTLSNEFWVVSVRHPDTIPGFDPCRGMGPCVGVHWTLPGAADADFTEYYTPGIGLVSSDGAWSSNVLVHRVIDGVSTTGVGPVQDPIRAFALKQNYPNPFNPATVISYDLSEACRVTLTVFDLMGRDVATLVDAFEEPGARSVTLDGTSLASGVYYYRLQAGDYTESKKLVVMR
jgi:hypothetical protein